MFIATYLTLLGGCALYAFWRGGVPERIAAALLCTAVAFSEIVSRSTDPKFTRVETGYLIVDGLTFAAFGILALRAQRYWPMYVAAILMDQIITHLLMLSPKLMPFSYSVMLAIWSFAKPPTLALATWRHRRRVIAYGSDPDWS